ALRRRPLDRRVRSIHVHVLAPRVERGDRDIARRNAHDAETRNGGERASNSSGYSTHPHWTLRNVGSARTDAGENLPADAAVASRKRNVVSRSALGRSDKRATSSTVGRVGGGGAFGVRAQATSDHAARELGGPFRAFFCASERGVGSVARVATSARTSHRPR